jgi:hypothetical protein
MRVLDVKITKKADDPRGVVRVSVGGSPDIGGWYLVYRGSKEEAIQALSATLQALKTVAGAIGPDREPDISPDDGKQYA